jgi:hypothetical protein
MTTQTILLLLLLAQSGLAQVYSVRAIGHTPFYERIFLPKGDPLRPPALRGVDDLRPEDHYPETNRIDRIFADPLRERTNSYYNSCQWEVPVDTLSLRRHGALLDTAQVRSLLRNTVVIPRSVWINHNLWTSKNWRYVFCLAGAKDQEYVIDLRAGAFAVIYFPDGTYRCVVGPGYSFLQKQEEDAATGSQPIRSETNRTSPATGFRR